MNKVKTPVHNIQGEVVGEIDLDDSVFDVAFRESVVHQAVTCLQANKRQGTACVKSRGEVSGSTRKLYAQKGTGHARRGSIKSPLMRGGGIVFGPSPRSYRQRFPKKMRRLALACALSMKLRTGELWVIEELDVQQPRTKDVAALLASAGKSTSTLIVTPESQPAIYLSARNLPGTSVKPCATLSTLDVMSAGRMIVTVPALRRMEAIWGSRGSGNESA